VLVCIFTGAFIYPMLISCASVHPIKISSTNLAAMQYQQRVPFQIKFFSGEAANIIIRLFIDHVQLRVISTIHIIGKPYDVF
jgi:hypothetical protein